MRVEQFVGQWVPLDPADLNAIGQVNSGLGMNLTVGDQVYDLGGALNIVVGPLDWTTYLTFVPGGFRYSETRALVKLYCCDPLAFTMQVTLSPGQVPPMHLTTDERAGALGLTTWVRSQEMGATTVTFAASEGTSVTLSLIARPRQQADAPRVASPARNRPMPVPSPTG
jgi:type VI secretion system protein ImpH